MAQVDAGQAEAAHRSGLIAYALTMGAALVLLECLRRARAGRSDGDDA